MGIREIKPGRWRVQVRKKGLPVLDHVCSSQAEAEKLLSEHLQLESKVKAREITVKDAWELLLDSAEWQGLSKNTHNAYKAQAPVGLAELGDYAIGRLEGDLDTVQRFLDKLSKREQSKETTRLQISVMSKIFEFMIGRRICRSNPFRGMRRPKPVRRSNRIGPSVLLRLRAALTYPELAEHCRFLLLIVYIGCRPGELAEALKSDITLARRSMLFRKTKNGSARDVFLVAAACQHIESQLRGGKHKDAPYLFAAKKRNGEWKPYNWRNGVALLRKRGVIDHTVHAHAGRREFISGAAEASVQVWSIQQQTGHKDLESLKPYLATAGRTREQEDELTKAAKVRLVQQMEAAQRDLMDMTTEDVIRYQQSVVDEATKLYGFKE